MDITTRNIEQCDAVSVLNAILDVYDKPTAKEVTLQQGIASILAAVGNISVDTSDLAKQGTNPNATLSDVQAKIGTPASGQTDLFAELANVAKQGVDPNATLTTVLQLVNPISRVVSFDGITLNISELPTNLSPITLYAQYAANVVSIFDNKTRIITQSNAFQGFINVGHIEMALLEEIQVSNPLFANNTLVEEFIANNLQRIDYYNPGTPLFNFPHVTSYSFPKLQYLQGSGGNYWRGVFHQNTVVQEIVLPICISISGSGNIRGCTSLKKLYVPELQSIDTNSELDGCSNLIDLTIGAGFIGNVSLASWNPTNAYSTTSKSLLTADEQIEHPTWYNIDKLLYNIREHFAANLRTDVGNHTITLHANIKSVINASPETLAAFPSNWTIA